MVILNLSEIESRKHLHQYLKEALAYVDATDVLSLKTMK